MKFCYNWWLLRKCLKLSYYDNPGSKGQRKTLTFCTHFNTGGIRTKNNMSPPLAGDHKNCLLSKACKEHNYVSSLKPIY